MDLKNKIEELAASFLSPIDAYIVEIQIAPGEKQRIIQLFIDTDIGITIDQCAVISRQLGSVLETSGIIQDSFILQVSSPGLKKPLKLLRQYKKNIGRQYKVRFNKNEGIKETLATLTAVEGELISFKDKKDEIQQISFNEIIESIEELPW